MYTKKKKRMIKTLGAIMVVQSANIKKEDIDKVIPLYVGLAKDIGGQKALNDLSDYATQMAKYLKDIYEREAKKAEQEEDDDAKNSLHIVKEVDKP